MDDNLLKAIIAQEKLNKICLKSLSISHSICDVLNKIKDEQNKEDIIDIILSHYIVNNFNDNSRKSIVNYIRSFAMKKDYLHNDFIENQGLANELISSYLKNYIYEMKMINDGKKFVPNARYDKLSNKNKEKISQISPIYNYLGFNYITNIARFQLYNSVTEIILEKKGSRFDNNNLPVLNNFNIFKRIIIGDAYTYMYYNNEGGEYDKYIYMIEENSSDLNKLWNKIIATPRCLYNFLFYITNLIEYEEYYSELYNINEEKNPNFKKHLQKINPYYIIDEIYDINEKKYRK